MEILDDISEDKPPGKRLTLFGRVFYGVEIGLWVSSILSFYLEPFVGIMAIPIIFLFYVVAGPLFAFRSGVFEGWKDRVIVVAVFATIVLVALGLSFSLQSWPGGRMAIMASFVVSLGLFIYILWQMIKRREEGPTIHMRLMLVRVLPVLFLSGSMSWGILIRIAN